MGKTTCERFSGLNKKQPLLLKENDPDQTFDSSKPKPRMSVLSLDDSPDYKPAVCSGPLKMCCNTKVVAQEELMLVTRQAYRKFP